MDFFDEDFADVVFFIVFLVRVTFVGGRIPPHGRNINHPSSKFNKSSSTELTFAGGGRVGVLPFDGEFQVCNVV